MYLGRRPRRQPLAGPPGRATPACRLRRAAPHVVRRPDDGFGLLLSSIHGV